MFELWFILSIIPPILYALINHIDKSLLDRYLKESGVETLLLFSALFSFFAIPYAVYMEPGVFDIAGQNILVMLLVAAFNIILLYCYLSALNEDSPTIVVLYYQLVPVIALGMGYVVLNETITQVQAMAMAVILLGTTIATFELTELKELRFKWRTFWFMLTAATCWAAETTLGKIVVIDESVYHSIFWESFMMVFLGLCIWIFRPNYRNAFKKTWKVNSGIILSLIIFGEAIYSLGNAVITHAVKYEAVTIVLLLQPMQTIFVYLLGLLFTLFIPSIYSEKITPLDLAQKVLAISITCYGSYLLLI